MIKYTLETKELMNALKCVMKSYEPKSYIPELQQLMICTMHDNLILYCSINETATKRTIHADFCGTDFEELHICFDPQKMQKGLKLFKELTTTVEITDKIILMNGNKTFNIDCSITKDENEVSACSELFEKFEVTEIVNNKQLPELLQRYNTIEFAISKEDTRPILQGINLKENKMCAMDGYRCAVSKDNSENALTINSNITIPKVVFDILKQCTKNEVYYSLAIDNKHGLTRIITLDEERNIVTDVVTRNFAGEYMPYEKAFPQQFISDVTLKTKPMIDDVKYLCQVQDKDNKQVMCWTGKRLDIKYGAIDIQADTIIKENNLDNIYMGLNEKYLLDVLQHINTDSFILKFAGAVTPMIIQTIEPDSYNDVSFLLCPMRIKK